MPTHLRARAAAPTARPAPAGRRALGFLLLLAALLPAVALSLSFGANPLPLAEVWPAIVRPDDGEAAIIVWTLRLPRTVAALVCGAAFGAAGALIQALTRNPLADPGILGVNAGAGFCVTIGVGVFGVTSATGSLWFAFIGAGLATVAVSLIGGAGRGRVSPVALVLAGVALGAVLTGLSTLLTLMSEDTFRSVRNWALGSVSRTSLEDTAAVLPVLAAGLALALAISGPLNAVALGEDLATSLGTSVTRTRALGVVGVTLLAGGATAITGGLAFVGLMVPHVIRWFTGPDQRWIVPLSALGGALLVVLADVIGRVIARPGEIEVGILTAVIGAPVLIALVRRGTVSGL